MRVKISRLSACSLLTVAVAALAAMPTIARAVNYASVCDESNKGTDLTVTADYYFAGYLECTSADANTSGTYVLREAPVGSGRFTLLVGGGGDYSVRDLIREGVPPKVAPSLWRGFRNAGCADALRSANPAVRASSFYLACESRAARR